MRFTSTRDRQHQVSLSEALLAGLAPDGGLYVPTRFAAFDPDRMSGPATLPSVATALLEPYFQDDPLQAALPDIVAEAFNFPAPLRGLEGDPSRLSLLELFHGPTAAFKDTGARFLAGCLSRMPAPASGSWTVLVATSGDTGAAVAAAFEHHPAIRVLVLYPHGQISPVQRRQLAGWGGHIQAIAVQGGFDDCQRLIKQAFADDPLRRRHALTSANSINIGRLLPQCAHFAVTGIAVSQQQGVAPDFAIPSGNLGHATACVWARAMGLPTGRILLAHNANRTVPDFLATGEWQPRPGIATIATAMDIGDPSNMERLRDLHAGPGELARHILATSIDDDAIRARIRSEYGRSSLVLCPHTAAAVEACRRLPSTVREGAHWIAVATAHPAKFPATVEPLIGRMVDPPPSLQRKTAAAPVRTISPTLDALRAVLEQQ